MSRTKELEKKNIEKEIERKQEVEAEFQRAHKEETGEGKRCEEESIVC